jgi:hypothetical protein
VWKIGQYTPVVNSPSTHCEPKIPVSAFYAGVTCGPMRPAFSARSLQVRASSLHVLCRFFAGSLHVLCRFVQVLCTFSAGSCKFSAGRSNWINNLPITLPEFSFGGSRENPLYNTGHNNTLHIPLATRPAAPSSGGEPGLKSTYGYVKASVAVVPLGPSPQFRAPPSRRTRTNRLAHEACQTTPYWWSTS